MKTLAVILTFAASTTAPLALSSPAGAVGETCNGQVATLVGSPGSTITGTAGADVIVTNGAMQVDAGAGDDVICTTGTVGHDTFNPAVAVLAGEGNDLVDRRGEMDPLAVGAADLGAGNNTFYGSAVRDLLNSRAGSSDVLSTGDGSDTVFLSYVTTVSTEVDTVDVGPGDDSVTVNSGFSTGLSLTGGQGTDSLTTNQSPAPGWTLDAAAGRVRAGATVYMSFSDFDIYTAYGDDPVAFIGSDRAERLFQAAAGMRSAKMGGGDDDLSVWIAGSKKKLKVEGGDGSDRITISGSKKDRFDLDLSRGRLRSPSGPNGRAGGFEHATVIGGHVVLTGTDGPNQLVWSGCQGGSVRAGGGADTVTLQVVDPEDYTCRSGHQPRLRAFGQGGSDALVGGPSGDFLIGGPGVDKAHGGPGQDVCRAEDESSCER